MAEQPVNIEAVEQLAMIDQRPVPGQSLTNNSENPLPFEGPPQTVRVTEALHGVFEELIEVVDVLWSVVFGLNKETRFVSATLEIELINSLLSLTVLVKFLIPFEI